MILDREGMQEKMQNEGQNRVHGCRVYKKCRSAGSAGSAGGAEDYCTGIPPEERVHFCTIAPDIPYLLVLL